METWGSVFPKQDVNSCMSTSVKVHVIHTFSINFLFIRMGILLRTGDDMLFTSTTVVGIHCLRESRKKKTHNTWASREDRLLVIPQLYRKLFDPRCQLVM